MTDNTAGRPWFTLNLILTGLIVLVFAYSLAFSPDNDRYPVPCVHEKLTGQPCPSCGLSHAFSLIIRGQVTEATRWNSHSPVVFGYFALQLVMRIAVAVAAAKPRRGLRRVLVADAVISGVMTLAVFYPFMKLLWMTLH